MNSKSGVLNRTANLSPSADTYRFLLVSQKKYTASPRPPMTIIWPDVIPCPN